VTSKKGGGGGLCGCAGEEGLTHDSEKSEGGDLLMGCVGVGGNLERVLVRVLCQCRGNAFCKTLESLFLVSSAGRGCRGGGAET